MGSRPYLTDFNGFLSSKMGKTPVFSHRAFHICYLSVAQPSRVYAMASGLQDRQHLWGGVAYDVARSAGPGARFLLPLPGSANLPLAVCLLTFRLLLRTRTLAYYSPSFSRPTPTPFFFTSTTILFVFSTQRITTSFIFPMFLRHGRCMCSTKDATTILTHSSVS